MKSVGLGPDKLGDQGLKTLYRMADKDGNGNIDFNEFLVAVVGNLVSL
jgi:Ca2+-binding EF-hand superfamily protein